MHNQPQRQDASPQLSFRGVWHTASASSVTSIVTDSARDVVATVSAGEDVALWRMDGSRKATLPNTHGARLALSPLGALLATASPDIPFKSGVCQMAYCYRRARCHTCVSAISR